MQIKGKFFTVANILSIIRVPLAFAACRAIKTRDPILAITMMLLCALSDFVDGKIARATGTVSDWGKILDPLADKIAIIALIFTLWLHKAIPLWFILVVVIRDIMIAVGGLLITGKTAAPPSSNKWGKITTFLMAVYIMRITVSYLYENLDIWPAKKILWGVDANGILALIFVIISLIVYSSDAIKLLRNPGQTIERSD